MLRRIKILTAIIVSLTILTSLLGCQGGEPVEKKAVYQITVQSQSGTLLDGVKIFVYEDDTQQELVFVGTTDEAGRVSFEDLYSETYVAVLTEVPACYGAQLSYAVEENTVIALPVRALTEEEMTDNTVGLSDQMPDFQVTDCDGNAYSLYALLEQKKAVVLNFWYLNCEPCKMEFPYLQEVYEEYSDDVAFIAMNPVDGTDEAVAAFRTELGLSFPMASCSIAWQNMMNLKAYPTTVIIDRNGSVCLIHRGMFTDSAALMNAMKYFTQEEYEQKFFELIEDVPQMG